LTRLENPTQSVYSLRGPNGTLVIQVGTRSAYWNGIEVRLGFAPQIIDGQPFVHGIDLDKNLQPLLKGWPNKGWPTNAVIVIDPGHGGADSGTRSVVGNGCEKDYTLDWAIRVRTLLAANGWQVWLTRSNDVDVAISNRVAFAERHQAAFFVSLHFNSAGPNQAEAGLETYCLTPTGLPSSLVREFADDTTLNSPNNAFDEQNFALAMTIHRALLQVNGHHDRGLRRARFPGVLRGQRRPAVLVEGGYLSNPHEAATIGDPAYRQTLAEAVAAAVNQFSGGAHPVAAPNQNVQTATNDSPEGHEPEIGAERPNLDREDPQKRRLGN
jgi:N-acetylmuramoyl-L-alanine amidase